MDKDSKKVIGLFSRYIVLILAGLGNLYIFYKILTPITLVTLKGILSLITRPIITNNFIFIKDVAIIEIAPACVAGAAFYLLFLLIFSTADMKPKTRAYALITSFVILFILNITRILFLIPMIKLSYFEVLHWVLWHIISTVFVVIVWFAVVKLYNIKSVPIYSDLKYIQELINPKSKKRKNPRRKKKNN